MGTPTITRVALPGFTRLVMRAKTSNDRAVNRRVAARACTREGAATGAALWRSFAADEYNLRPRANELRAPTLIVWGRKDVGVPLWIGRATQAALPGSRLEVLDTGHMPFSSEPWAFLAVVKPFIESVAETTLTI